MAAKWLGLGAVGIEIDPDACSTRRSAGLNTDQADVRERGPADYPEAVILAGGPPCQTYSVAGSGAGRERLEEVRKLVIRMATHGYRSVAIELADLADERTGLVLEPLRWILAAFERKKPYEVVVLEQVPAVLPVWQQYAEVLREMGYDAAANIMRAEEYGVPQTRRRAILIAVRGRRLAWPVSTHRKFGRGSTSGSQDGKSDWNSMADALGHRGGFVVVSNYGTGGRPDQRGRRSFNEPAYTVTGKVTRNRILNLEDKYIDHISVEDASVLQTFPRNYPWSGKDISQQIGNAIPPRLAAHVLSNAVFGAPPNDELLEAAVQGNWQQVLDGCISPRRIEDDLDESTVPNNA